MVMLAYFGLEQKYHWFIITKYKDKHGTCKNSWNKYSQMVLNAEGKWGQGFGGCHKTFPYPVMITKSTSDNLDRKHLSVLQNKPAKQQPYAFQIICRYARGLLTQTCFL